LREGVFLSSEKTKVQKKNIRFYQLDNEILLDYDLSTYALILYNWISMYAFSGGAYISKSKLAKKYKVSRNRFIDAEKELIDKYLIKKTGYKAGGPACYELLQVKKRVFSDGTPQEEPVPGENKGCSEAEQEPVPGENINNTYNNTNNNINGKGKKPAQPRAGNAAYMPDDIFDLKQHTTNSVSKTNWNKYRQNKEIGRLLTGEEWEAWRDKDFDHDHIVLLLLNKKIGLRLGINKK
jgi:hypothetical protein